MKTETYRGSKIRVKSGKTAGTYGKLTATVNGEHFPTVESFDETKALIEIRKTLDYVYASPVDGDRWPASYYAPGTYEICDAGIHPREANGQCTHSTCRA